jgi:hypothetical protein
MLAAKLGFIGQTASLEKNINISQSETRIACGGHVCLWIGTK